MFQRCSRIRDYDLTAVAASCLACLLKQKKSQAFHALYLGVWLWFCEPFRIGMTDIGSPWLSDWRSPQALLGWERMSTFIMYSRSLIHGLQHKFLHERSTI